MLDGMVFERFVWDEQKGKVVVMDLLQSRSVLMLLLPS
ncbi:hypothetical protein LCGC14_2834530, partial [marine sediment metagenome]